MAWHINLVKNTILINEEIAHELFRHDDACIVWDPAYEGEVMDHIVSFEDDGQHKLYFNDDHMEHMDYLHMDWAQDILKKHKVKGDVCFSSNDGDNAGQSWGYRFDGKGGMVELVGVLFFKPVTAPRAPKRAKKPVKGVTPSQPRKVTKKAPRVTRSPSPGKSKVTWTKNRGKLVWVCTSCYEDKALPETCRFGAPRGRDVRHGLGGPRYCGTCGEDHSVKKIRVW